MKHTRMKHTGMKQNKLLYLLLITTLGHTPNTIITAEPEEEQKANVDEEAKIDQEKADQQEEAKKQEEERRNQDFNDDIISSETANLPRTTTTRTTGLQPGDSTEGTTLSIPDNSSPQQNKESDQKQKQEKAAADESTSMLDSELEGFKSSAPERTYTEDPTEYKKEGVQVDHVPKSADASWANDGWTFESTKIVDLAMENSQPLDKNALIRELSQRTNETYRSMRVDSLLKDINNKIAKQEKVVKEKSYSSIEKEKLDKYKERAQQIVYTINESRVTRDGKTERLFEHRTIVQMDGKFVLEKDSSSSTAILKNLLEGNKANEPLTKEQESSILEQFTDKTIDYQHSWLSTKIPLGDSGRRATKRVELVEDMLKRLNNKPDSVAARRIVEMLNDDNVPGTDGKPTKDPILKDYTIVKNAEGKWELKKHSFTEENIVKDFMKNPDKELTSKQITDLKNELSSGLRSSWDANYRAKIVEKLLQQVNREPQSNMAKSIVDVLNTENTNFTRTSLLKNRTIIEKDGKYELSTKDTYHETTLVKRFMGDHLSKQEQSTLRKKPLTVNEQSNLIKALDSNGILTNREKIINNLLEQVNKAPESLRADSIIDTLNKSGIKPFDTKTLIIDSTGNWGLSPDPAGMRDSIKIVKDALKNENPEQAEQITNNLVKELSSTWSGNSASRRLEIVEELVRRLNNKPDSTITKDIIDALNKEKTTQGNKILPDREIVNTGTKENPKWEVRRKDTLALDKFMDNPENQETKSKLINLLQEENNNNAMIGQTDHLAKRAQDLYEQVVTKENMNPEKMEAVRNLLDEAMKYRKDNPQFQEITTFNSDGVPKVSYHIMDKSDRNTYNGTTEGITDKIKKSLGYDFEKKRQAIENLKNKINNETNTTRQGQDETVLKNLIKVYNEKVTSLVPESATATKATATKQ